LRENLSTFKVLFLGTENACRSQMAEGLVNHDLAGQVKACSAGVREGLRERPGHLLREKLRERKEKD